MPLPATLLVIATLLPLASFLVLVFFGKRMGNPLAGWVATAAILGSFACAMATMFLWLPKSGQTYVEPVTNKQVPWGLNQGPINIPIKWIPVGLATRPEGVGQPHPGFLDVGIYVDSLTVAMFAMITLIATLIHIFSIGYMHEDKRFPRFFTYLSLFCFSMLGLVIGGTILQLFVFWELVGLCSYLLIGFWYEKKSASNAAIKAFVTNRVGDFGFLIGLGILFYHLGNVALPNLWVLLGGAGTLDGAAHGYLAVPGVGNISSTLLTIMGVGLFFGAVGKSAQFPLHVWLPDAMEGPTPVSALIHAATMVAAGVYLVGRIFPILTPDAKLFIAIIGCVTLTMAALIALAQTDIKKVLAYSTLSQLGYMILALGIGSYIGGLFHLITHAFFKALLFLGSGSVIYAAHHEQEMPQYGGLWKKIPITAATFFIAVLAIAGTPFLSGYYSKDMILMHAGAFGAWAEANHRSNLYWVFWLFPTIIAYVTAFYMMRCWMLTFAGKPRNMHVYDHAHERPVMYGPLVALAVLSVIAGKWLNVQEMIQGSRQEATILCQRIKGDTKFQPFGTSWPAHPPEATSSTTGEESAAPMIAKAAEHGHDPMQHGEHLVHTYVYWAFVVGIGLGFLVYAQGYWITGPLMKIAPLNWIRIWLYRRMYFDELYFAVFVGVVMALSRLSAWVDRYVVDGIVNLAGWSVRGAAELAGLNDKYVVDGAVNGAAALTQDLGAAVRAPQTGRIRVYVMVLVAVVSVGLAAAIVVALS
ncbi:MAG TPA: NADH-quinone oxidoreductase subunit L [Tepidisphaeraceae bacterium]|jgi:proton-translocating NADH-quinone oxidoreductase chain L